MPQKAEQRSWGGFMGLLDNKKHRVIEECVRGAGKGLFREASEEQGMIEKDTTGLL